jgi:hypothetical protein
VKTDPPVRTPFARIARAALEQGVPEARTAAAQWGSKPNSVWVRWALPDGWHASIGLRRHLDWVTGELGLAREPADLDLLPLLAQPQFDTEEVRARGGRVRLGVLRGEDDTWWPAGDTDAELEETLGLLALQLRVKAGRLLHVHVEPRA